MSGPTGVLSAAATNLGNRRPTAKIDLWICYWVLPIFYCLFGVMFVPLARVMPPPSPGKSPEQIVAFFHDHALTIQIGFGMLMVIIGFAGVTNGLVVFQIRRMSVHPVLAYAYLGALAVGAIPGCLFAAIVFLTAVFRPDRDPQIVALLYDTALLSFVGSLGCFSTGYLVFAVAIFLDTNAIFPRWLAYVTIWQIVTELLAAPVFVFRRGPFAWNGSISFWMGTAIFAFWQVCVIILVRTAVQRQSPDEQLAD